MMFNSRVTKFRLTPACAGRTPLRAPGSWATAADPRLRGEDRSPGGAEQADYG